MNASLSWIKMYVPDLDVSAQEYADAMTLSGTIVEDYKSYDADISDIVVGQIKKIEQHPDADKLVVCQVDVGSRTVQIVTGATNVFEGAMVPVVMPGGKIAGKHDGTMVPGGITIESGKLRGIESCGMMCSIEELGMNTKLYPEAPENGIYIFKEEVTPGDDALEVLGLHDVNIEYEITSNRVDCYSVMGIAREAAAVFGKKFIPPKINKTGNNESVNDYVKVTVKDPQLCLRYCARVVKNIKIAPSPKWMQRCLASSGIRPINNLVDITNYIMEEYGQPMHAFDLDTVSGREIIVHRASANEKFVTLDGQERTMDENVLMICDKDKPIGIAGIMGGENSMITDNVKTVLFESACFDGTNIRLSSKRIGLRTDASGKYEKGLDPNMAMEAVDRACHLIEELGVGEVVGGAIDVYANPVDSVRIPLEPDKINALLGTELSKDEMIKYLASVELKYDNGDIIAPTFRGDMKASCDLAEEVARLYGYDKIGETLPAGEGTFGKRSFEASVEAVATSVALANGFSQSMSYSFESPKVFDKLLIPSDDKIRKAIPIQNPLGEDFSIMRTISLNGMLTSLATNYSYRNKNVRLFELANIYIPEKLPLEELPDERMTFTLGMYGDGDFFELKGVIEEFFEQAGLLKRCKYTDENKKPYLHPGRQAQIIYEDTVMGYFGEMHPLVTKKYGIGDTVYIAVIDLPSVCGKATFDRRYEGVAKFPAVNRDLSMIVPKDIPAGQIEDMMILRGGKLLESCTLFDVYEGEQVEKGCRSLAYSLVFRDKEKTLEDAQVNSTMKKILNGLSSMGINLRS